MNRLGCKRRRNFDDVKLHPWLSTFDWDNLESKTLQSPFVPDVRGCMYY